MKHRVPHPLPNMFFITGRGRSGTWLLQSILDSHPQVSVAPEALFTVNLYHKYKNTTKWDAPNIQAFVEDLFWDKKIPQWWKMDKERVAKYLATLPVDANYQTVITAIYQLYASKQGKAELTYLGDKNPEYTLFIETLCAIFPEAKFIHLVRDPRSNVLSYQKVTFDLNDTAALALRWVKYNAAALRARDKYPERILFVRFEELVTQPAVILAKIGHFLNLESTENLHHRFFDSSKNIFSWNKKIAEPLDPSRVDAWKKQIQTTELSKINYLTQKICTHLGYDCPGKPSLPPNTLPALGLGGLKGWVVNTLEEVFFYIPFRWRMNILNYYRQKMKIVE